MREHSEHPKHGGNNAKISGETGWGAADGGGESRAWLSLQSDDRTCPVAACRARGMKHMHTANKTRA